MPDEYQISVRAKNWGWFNYEVIVRKDGVLIDFDFADTEIGAKYCGKRIARRDAKRCFAPTEFTYRPRIFRRQKGDS